MRECECLLSVCNKIIQDSNRMNNMNNMNNVKNNMALFASTFSFLSFRFE